MREVIDPPSREQLAQFHVLVSSDANDSIVSLQGELDLLTAPRLERTLDQLCRNGCQQIILDLSQLTFLSATGLNVLVNAHEMLRNAGGRLVLTRPSRMARRLLFLTGVDITLTIE